MGIKQDYPLTQEEFDTIYAKVPRLTVELILRSDAGVLLTKRTIEPCIGKWHLPGGTVYYGESIDDAVKRIAQKELGINVKAAKQIGIIEYPDHVASGYGDPRGIAHLIEGYEGEIHIDAESDAYDWFTVLPADMHVNQDTFLLEKELIRAS